MTDRIPLPREARADDPERDRERDDATHEAAMDIAYKRLGIVNVVFVGPRQASDRGWVLVDCGVPGSAGLIRRAAEARFGEGARPAAIVLTHAHFDHVGGVETLAAEWDAPVVAHELEAPYLRGEAGYPPPDPHVGRGLMARLSPLYPKGPVDVSERLEVLSADGRVPHLPEWRWLHTPGHTPGHVSFWREADRTLLVGDAFVTTRQESVYKVAAQTLELNGPPAYFTQDWEAARRSVERLAMLEPERVVTGHGRAMQGPRMRDALDHLARAFDAVAVPDGAAYRRHPSRAEDGSAYRRP